MFQFCAQKSQRHLDPGVKIASLSYAIQPRSHESNRLALQEDVRSSNSEAGRNNCFFSCRGSESKTPKLQSVTILNHPSLNSDFIEGQKELILYTLFHWPFLNQQTASPSPISREVNRDIVVPVEVGNRFELRVNNRKNMVIIDGIFVRMRFNWLRGRFIGLTKSITGTPIVCQSK